MILHKFGFYGEDQYTCACDGCSKKTTRQSFSTPGDATDQARKEGFTAKFKTPTSPAVWVCAECSSKPV